MGLKVFRTKNGSSKGQNLAVTILCVPNSLDGGKRKSRGRGQGEAVTHVRRR